MREAERLFTCSVTRRGRCILATGGPFYLTGVWKGGHLDNRPATTTTTATTTRYPDHAVLSGATKDSEEYTRV